MTKEKKEMNSEVRQYRTPGDELQQKHHQSPPKSQPAMRIASLDEMGTSPGRWSSSGGAENVRNKKVK